MSKGHLAEYVKGVEKAKEIDSDEEDEEPGKTSVNRLVIGIIDAIYVSTSQDMIT